MNVPDLPPTSSCPRCGTALRCGMVGGDSQCWCFAMPHVIAVPAAGPKPASGEAAASCLCPACLQLLIASHE